MKTYRTIARLSLILLMFALSSHSVFACLNPVGDSLIADYFDIKGVSGPELVKKLQSHQDRAYWDDILRQTLEQRKNDPNLYSPTNHAVTLAHLGRVKEAIAIFEGVERKVPGMYETAANLGTAYELNGENDKALKWIQEGFRCDKDGHSGTEWLHVKILEAKIRLSNVSGVLPAGSVLDMRFDDRPELSEWFTTDHLGQRKNVKEIEKALAYQLHERLEFLKPPEPVVADLLADLSKVLALTRAPEDAEAVYELARSYGTTRPIYTKPAVALPQKVVDESWSSRTVAIIVAGVFILFVVAGCLLWIRRRT